MFERVAYQGYSGRRIYDWLKDETTLRSRNGNILGLSVVYRMLNNPYYCGIFEYDGKWYKGSYEPIISRELFDAVQKKMTVAPKSKPGTKQFDFTRLFKCGACSSGITAQEKLRRLKSGEIRRHVYYHCTQFNNYDCHEPYLSEEKLIEQLSELLRQISVETILNKTMLKPELDKFMLIHRMQNENVQGVQPKFDLSGFIRYIFKDGTKEQKRELISCLNTTIYIKNKQVVLQK